MQDKFIPPRPSMTPLLWFVLLVFMLCHALSIGLLDVLGVILTCLLLGWLSTAGTPNARQPHPATATTCHTP